MTIEERLANIKEAYPNSTGLLLKLRDERAYTLLELAKFAKLFPGKTGCYLDQLLKADILKTRSNRKRKYFYLADKRAGEVIDSWNLPGGKRKQPTGMKYCRHCYKHLAGYVGVKFTASLVENGFIIPGKMDYSVTEKGWKWFSKLEIKKEDFSKNDRQFAKQCLDFSERKSHLGGRLGDALLKNMLAKHWLEQVPSSREITINGKGKTAFKKELGLILNTQELQE